MDTKSLRNTTALASKYAGARRCAKMHTCPLSQVHTFSQGKRLRCSPRRDTKETKSLPPPIVDAPMAPEKATQYASAHKGAPIASPPRVRTKHVESGAAGHKQRRKAENSHCTARRARHHHAGHIESSAGLAEMREQIRQAIKKTTGSPCKQMPLSAQREGPTWRPFSGRKKKPQKCEPQQLGFTPLGPFWGAGKMDLNLGPLR